MALYYSYICTLSQRRDSQRMVLLVELQHCEEVFVGSRPLRTSSVCLLGSMYLQFSESVMLLM